MHGIHTSESVLLRRRPFSQAASCEWFLGGLAQQHIGCLVLEPCTARPRRHAKLRGISVGLSRLQRLSNSSPAQMCHTGLGGKPWLVG